MFSSILVGQGWEPYGAPISEKDYTQLEQVLQNSKEGESVKIKGVISEVCQMKGCWMTLKNEEGSLVRVTFKDYGFFVPKDASDANVILEGEISFDEIDEETARHYAEDAGREYDPERDLTQISIVANGVLIQKP